MIKILYEYYLDLKEFSNFLDINKVSYYTLEIVQDDPGKSMVLKFYDKNKKRLKIQDKDENKSKDRGND